MSVCSARLQQLHWIVCVLTCNTVSVDNFHMLIARFATTLLVLSWMPVRYVKGTYTSFFMERLNQKIKRPSVSDQWSNLKELFRQLLVILSSSSYKMSSSITTMLL
jgi:hypothetical protein